MKKITIVLLLLFTAIVNAQLSNFNLTLSKTDETCLGNGSITFTVSNTTQNAALLYKVYKLPNVTEAVSITTQNYLSGLSAGEYKVVAMQSLGSLLNTKEQNITLNNLIGPFAFSLSSSNQSCQAGGTISINVTAGVFSSCEIIAGPQVRPLQNTNVFNDLPSGTYNIRVFNNCGVGKVKTFTLSLVNSVLNISDPEYPDLVSPLCDSITVNNTITPSAGSINYPIAVRHTLNALDINGNQIVIDQTFTSGPSDAKVISVVLPRHVAESYTYDISVTDNCNAVYEKLANEVDPNIVLSLSPVNAPCAEKYLKVTASRYTGSYTVTFLSVPDGFVPSAFNATPQGPFTEGSVVYGSTTNPVPFGNYEVQITDSCGRTTTESLLIEFVKPTPSAAAYNNGCFSEFGRIVINVPPQKLVHATITTAPPAYTGALPVIVDASINSQGTLNLYDLPLGSYNIIFTDNCGFEYEKTVTVPPFVEKDFDITTLPSCDQGYGAVRYKSGNGILTDTFITAAPPAFNQTLPYNVSANLTADGAFYMSGLPEGTYKFSATDVCGIVKEKSVNVEGYMPPQNPFIYTPNCGGFSVKVTDMSNGLEGSTYWLQKYNPQTETWGHPNTGVAYNFNDVPVEANSLRLNNNTVRNNLNYTGKFRVVKKFETFTTGSSQNTMCVSILGEFTYSDVLKINTAYTLACLGNPDDVMLEVTGQPVSYKIVKKNGENFYFDNGNNNIFTNVEPAEYVFRIEDACGNVVSQWFNVQTLPSIADATQPDDLVVCLESNASHTAEFRLADQTEDVLGPLYSAMYTVTYHLNYEDADNGVNALPEYYTNITNGQTIYARVIHNEIALCHGITSFRLFVGEYQEPLVLTSGTICNEGELTLSVNHAYDSYLWSTGETTRTIKVTNPGTYTVIVAKAYGTGFCDGVAELEIKESHTPKIEKIDTEDWSEENNTITVHTKDEGEYLYSLDGIKYQTENTFTGLGTGKFTIFVKDLNGCGQDIKEVVLLNYPRFFTPNGDGSHDTWYIKYAVLEPHFNVRIMDRYGKLITAFGSTGKGWDGTLNGIQLPSTDYWFVVTREDGRELKGHFAMLR